MIKAYSSRYSMITVLSLRLRGIPPGSLVSKRSAGTRPFGETCKSSSGFLYGSTSSENDRQYGSEEKKLIRHTQNAQY